MEREPLYPGYRRNPPEQPTAAERSPAVERSPTTVLIRLGRLLYWIGSGLAILFVFAGGALLFANALIGGLVIMAGAVPWLIGLAARYVLGDEIPNNRKTIAAVVSLSTMAAGEALSIWSVLDVNRSVVSFFIDIIGDHSATIADICYYILLVIQIGGFQICWLFVAATFFGLLCMLLSIDPV